MLTGLIECHSAIISHHLYLFPFNTCNLCMIPPYQDKVARCECRLGSDLEASLSLTLTCLLVGGLYIEGKLFSIRTKQTDHHGFIRVIYNVFMVLSTSGTEAHVPYS